MAQLMTNDLITLRAIEPEDIDLLYTWENDPEVWKVSHTLVPYSKYILALYIQNSDKDIYESRQLRLMITTKDNRPIGAIDLFDFDPQHARAGIGILIYRKEDRGKGFASAALTTLMDYCFNYLKLHQLYANIEPNNTASIELFSKNGFEQSGLKKDWNRTLAGYEDEAIYQKIRPDKL